MSPRLTVLGCDRAGCQHKSNGDEASWWAVVGPGSPSLLLVPYFEINQKGEARFFCGQACAIAEISDWMAQQRRQG